MNQGQLNSSLFLVTFSTCFQTIIFILFALLSLQSCVAMDLPRLDLLAFEEVHKDLKSCRRLLNTQPLLPKDIQDKCRNTFIRQSSLLSSAYEQAIGKVECSEWVSPKGRFDAGFDEDFRSIVINVEDSKLTGGSIDSYEEWVEFSKARIIDFDGSSKYWDVSYSSPHFNRKNRYCTADKIKAINSKYRTNLSGCVSINPTRDNVLQVDRYNRKIHFYDFSRYNSLKDFSENRMPFNQALFLTVIEKVKEQGRRIALTKKEQEVYSGLLPGIQKVYSNHVRPYQEKFTIGVFFRVLRDVILKPECWDLTYEN